MIPRFIRRILYRQRVRYWARELDALNRVSGAIGPAIVRAHRNLSNARSDLAFLDIHRPPISHAAGAPRRDGVVRQVKGMP
jgi:hypothetical protein